MPRAKKPAPVTFSTAMTAADVVIWLAAMRTAGIARFDKQAAAAIGVDPRTLVRWAKDGVPADRALTVSLACRAALAGL